MKEVGTIWKKIKNYMGQKQQLNSGIETTDYSSNQEKMHKKLYVVTYLLLIIPSTSWNAGAGLKLADQVGRKYQ